MKKSLTTIAMGMALAAAAAGQTQPKLAKAAVIEFTPGPKASDMTDEAKRQLQASIAFSLKDSHTFDIVDVRHTREASQSVLAQVNDDRSTAAAVKVGKQLGVSYVLTGTAASYSTNDGKGYGLAVLRPRLVEVATGAVKYAAEIAQRSGSPMRTSGTAEMHTKVLQPAIKRLTEALGGKL